MTSHSSSPLASPLVAKIIPHDDGQAVLLPAGVRFDGDELYLRRDPRTGDVILSVRPDPSWPEFISLRHRLGPLPADALCDRVQGTQRRDPFDTWAE